MGVEKKLLVEGDEDADSPVDGSMVTVHYTLSLENGTVIESSKNKGKPFNFTVGEGRVIKGWEVAIVTMKPGETSVFTITPDYGYGNKRVGSIPANSVLIFEIELVDFI